MKKIFQATNCISREELEHYAKGEIPETLRYKIENHLVDCPLCSEALEGYTVLEGDSEEVFKDLFQSIDSRTTAKTPTVRERRIPWNRIAAALLFLIVAGAAFLYYQSTATGNKYLAYFEQQDGSLATRGVEANTLPVAMKAGVNLYQNKNFQASLSFFEDYLKTNPESTKATYYAGMSALNVGERETAFDLLSIVRLNDDQLYEEATWVLARIYLERGEIDNAKALLEDLNRIEGGFFVDRAKSLLEAL